MNHCASVIQKWYRGQAQKRKLLNEKKKELLSTFESSYRTIGKKPAELITQKINLKTKDTKVNIIKVINITHVLMRNRNILIKITYYIE